MPAALATEASTVFDCFGGSAAVLVTDARAERRASSARALLEGWHRRFSRFDPTSELSLLGASRGGRTRVSDVMARLLAAALDAAERTGGLVDPTLVTEIEAAGYATDLREPALPLAAALRIAPARNPARPRADARWRELSVDLRANVVSRPAGLRIDSGGVGKGLFADLAANTLADCPAYAVDCCGDVRVGGTDAIARPVRVEDPFGRGVVRELSLTDGGVATSGIGRRSWLGADGRPAHHLLDPATGRPAFTGVVQATALAPTATEAELRAKAALLSGPAAGRSWLEEHGGVLVLDDGSHELLPAR